jgi:hypothetical protein
MYYTASESVHSFFVQINSLRSGGWLVEQTPTPPTPTLCEITRVSWEHISVRKRDYLLPRMYSLYFSTNT